MDSQTKVFIVDFFFPWSELLTVFFSAFADPVFFQQGARSDISFCFSLVKCDTLFAEIIFDQGLGEVFVVRMAGNILDANAHGDQ